MSRALMLYLGVFTAVLAIHAVPQFLAQPPTAVIPGILLFAFFSAVLPAAIGFAGFALGYVFLRRRAAHWHLLGLGLLLAPAAFAVRHVTYVWTDSNLIAGRVFSATLLLGGLAVSLLPDFRKRAP